MSYKVETAMGRKGFQRLDKNTLNNWCTFCEMMWSKKPWNITMPLESWRCQLQEESRKKNYVAFIAREINGKEKFVGYCTGYELTGVNDLLFELKNSAYAFQAKIFLDKKPTFLFCELCVHPDYQKNGIGSALIKARLDYVLTLKHIERIVFYTHRRAKIPRRAYEEIGFKRLDIFDPQNPELDFYTYEICKTKKSKIANTEH